MTEWRKVRLGDICEISAGGDRPQLVSDKETNICHVPIYSNGVDNDGLYGFTDKEKIKGDSITITARGANVGTVFYRKTAYYPIIRLLSLQPNEELVNSRYLYYLIKDKTFLSTGSAQPQITVPNISKYVIEYDPDVVVQHRIAEVLFRYDALIENYQRQIKLLEEAAQRLYKQWFVDLRFPGHQSTPIINNLPQSWQKKKLGEIADVNCKSISRDYPFDFVDYIDLGAVREGHIEKPTRYLYGEEPGRAKRVASDGDIIWGMVRPNLKAYALVQNPKRSEVFSTGFSIITARDVPFSFLYCAVTTEAFVGYLVNCTNGAAYPAVKAEHFEKADLIIPSKMVLDNFHQHVGRMYRTIGYLQTQIRNLSEARNRLLPKLMSTEIEV